MKLSPEQWQALKDAVEADDCHRAEKLLDAVFIQMRRREQAAIERTKRVQRQAARPWIPQE
jgi:hypothetical protein